MTETKSSSSNETMLILLDNTVLSNFGQAGRSDLIFSLWESASTTTQVLQEYKIGAKQKKVPADAWHDLHLVTLTPEESTFVVEHLSNLGIGESSCLAVAYHRNGAVLTDDKQARKIAQKLALQVSGTLGVLVLCVVDKIVTLEEANTILQKMIFSGYRSPTTQLETLIPRK